MPSDDLEPASALALAKRINLECEPNSGDAWLRTATALINEFAAAVREPLERRIAELEDCIGRRDGRIASLKDQLASTEDELESAKARGRKLEAQLASAREAVRWRRASAESPPDAFTRIVWCGFRAIAFYENGRWWQNETGGTVERTGVHFWRDLPDGPSDEEIETALTATTEPTGGEER